VKKRRQPREGRTGTKTNFRGCLAQRPQFLLVHGGRGVGGPGLGLFGGADPVVQGLVVDAQLAGDLPQRSVRRAGQSDGVPADCSGYFDLPDTRNILPQTTV
jgi:hypothetical protein